MNKFGLVSLLMVAGSVTVFFIRRGPGGDIYLDILLLIILSIFGLLFATLSRKILWMIVGIGLNFSILMFAFFLLLAMGIGEP